MILLVGQLLCCFIGSLPRLLDLVTSVVVEDVHLLRLGIFILHALEARSWRVQELIASVTIMGLS